MKKQDRRVGYSWRVLAWANRGHKRVAMEYVKDQNCQFDELVIDDFLHIEQMDTRAYWARIGDIWMWISIDLRGRANVTVERGQYGPELGRTVTTQKIIPEMLTYVRAKRQKSK